MNISTDNIIPITEARGKLGSLTEKTTGETIIILTKGGKPKTALVDIAYLTKLQNAVKRLYQKTFIEPNLLPYTREFTDAEIKEWEKEDVL